MVIVNHPFFMDDRLWGNWNFEVQAHVLEVTPYFSNNGGGMENLHLLLMIIQVLHACHISWFTARLIHSTIQWRNMSSLVWRGW